MKLHFTLLKVRGSLKKSKSSHRTPQGIGNPCLGDSIALAMKRLEARWYIDTYEMMEDGMEPLLLESAKLDFNMVKADFQEDLNTSQVLKFSRDRWVETFFWAVGCTFEPKFGNYGRHLTKLCCHDMYDIYSSPGEVKMFTEAIERWDINTVEDLPYYMKVCFMAMFNTQNEIAYDVLKKHGFHAISYLKTSMADYCKSVMEEAKWYKYKTTLEEYISNAWMSVSGCIISSVAFFVLTKEPTKEAFECIMDYNSSEIRRSAFTVMRLANDLATSSDELKRGDIPTAIQCYMHESGVSESDAREHIKHLISETWMNNDKFSRSLFPESFIDSMQSIARASQCIYQFGDGYGVAAESLTKGNAMLMFFQPIPVACDEDI
ncbi:hypothetical protein MKW98_015818 [Papaver atlanticum]|uniref:Terpene synthase metal-binding domain-containing protein n=1 Tax=Papaver atlanticum TaxID=357466 RepID=A0AAD4TE39_9MAGN|nr:hypothetical protein MKW98_015818 [Papaver atlanticum]